MDCGKLIRFAFGTLPVLALLALLFAVLFLAGDAETNESRLGRWLPWLLFAAGGAVALLLGVIAAQFAALFRRYRARVPGARLAARWTLALVLLVLPPVLLVYGFGLRFLAVTIDSWFNVRVGSALEDALALAQLYVGDEMRAARNFAERSARQLAATNRADWPDALDAALDAGGALQLAAFTRQGTLLGASAADSRFLLPAAPDSSTLLRIGEDGEDFLSEPLGEELVLRVVRAIDADAVLLAVMPLPARAQPLARNIEASWHDYQRLEFLRDSLKLTFALLLSAVLLLSLLLAVLAALRVARRQAAPVARLAEGTQAIAAGRYGEELPAGGDDEIGGLTESFNRMSRELAAANRRERSSRADSERQRKYVETVLERLSSGVLTYDHETRLRTGNAAADSILGIALAPWFGQRLSALAAAEPALAPLTARLEALAREGRGSWREELVLARESGQQVLVLRGAALPPDPESEAQAFVAVFDDQTVLNQMQREAAWAEVARRLAHEVKNPLTPIQLATERLKFRLAGKLAPEDAELLERATRTVIAQVEALKGLVNAFGDYARAPQLEFRPLVLDALVGEVLDLYEQGQPLRLTRRLAGALPPVRGDAGRLRQLLHNLIKNALEASGAEPEIEVATRLVSRESEPQVELEIADRGAGLPEGFDASWFEPYRTSKLKGTGLGLAVVRKVVEEHGGSIRAEARDGGGARFVVSLPVAKATGG
jgi:nitrogen fixation/metabolism regulation signal transduction histidine kinase